MTMRPDDAEDGAVRLSKRVAALAGCSRTDAERYIEGGWVKVDGRVADLPQARVAPQQQVTLDPSASLLAMQPLTVLLHQPAGGEPLRPLHGSRWDGDAKGPRAGPGQLRQLAPLMDLPAGAGGLRVFSQDRRIVRRLTEDVDLIEEELLVDVRGDIAEGGLQRLAAGLPRERGRLPPMKASWQSEHRLRLAVKAVDPALVPWMCAQVGLEAVQVRRLRLGRVPLAGLPAGTWRVLGMGERF